MPFPLALAAEAGGGIVRAILSKREMRRARRAWAIEQALAFHGAAAQEVNVDPDEVKDLADEFLEYVNETDEDKTGTPLPAADDFPGGRSFQDRG